MIRHFCDVCGDEVTRNYVSERLTSTDAHMGTPSPGAPGVLVTYGKPRVQFEVHVGVGAAWNAGDLCLHCLLSAISGCDNRAKAAS